jgi:hypothetical protein
MGRRPLPPGVKLTEDTLLSDLERMRRRSNGLGVADYLRLPPRLARIPASPEQRLAAALPTWYAGALLDPALAADPAFVAVMAVRGLPIAFRRALRAVAPSAVTLGAETRFRFELIQYLLRPADIDEAIALSSRWRPLAVDAAEEEDATFYLATALSLRGGGMDGEDMFPEPPPQARPAAFTMGNIEPLEVFLSRSPASPLADLALWNAAAFFERFAWRRHEPSFYLEAADRYREASERIQTRELAFDCERRASVMEDIRKGNR